MLHAMRKRLSSFFVTILMGLLILSFAVWGIGDIFRTDGGDAIATVGDIKVSSNDFVREFDNELRRLQQQVGPEFDAAQARDLGLHRQVLARMVSRASFDAATRELGLQASDEQVREYIANNEAFHNSFNEFDRAIYEMLLQRIGFTPAQYEKATRQDLAREQLLTALGTSVSVPETLSRRLFAYTAEQREFDFIRIVARNINNVPEPDEDELRAYHEANADRYMAPEYRSLIFTLVTSADLAEEVALTEEEIRRYYDYNVDEFAQSERRMIEQVVLLDESDANAAYEALEAGESFEDVAREYADLGADELELGMRTERDLVDDVSNMAARAVFETEQGEPTTPQQSAFGWHILRATAIEPGQETSFEEARDDIVERLAEEAAIDRLFDVANNLESEMARGAALEDVARSVGVEAIRIEAVDRSGRAPSGEKIDELPDVEGFLDEVFRVRVNADPILQEAGTNGYYALQVTDVTEPALRPLEDVRARVASDWKAEERMKRAKERAEAISADAEANQDLDALAQSGEEVQEGVVIIRDPGLGGSEMSANIRDAVYATDPGKVTVTPASDESGYLVIRVNSKTPGDPDASSENLGQLAGQIRRQYGNDVLGSFQNHVERDLGFTFNERLLEDTMTQLLDRSL